MSARIDDHLDAYPDPGCYLVSDHRIGNEWALWRVRPEGDYLLVTTTGHLDDGSGDADCPASSGFAAAFGCRLPAAKARALEFAAQHLRTADAWQRVAAQFAEQYGEPAWDTRTSKRQVT